MEDKTFDLMTKFYNEFSSFKTDVNTKLDNLQSGQQKHENDIIRLENKIDTNSKALFDGYEQTYEKIIVIERKVESLSDKVERLSDKVESLSDKVEKQGVEIKVIKGGKA